MTTAEGESRLLKPVIRDLAPEEDEPCVNLWHQCGLLVPHNDPHADIALFRSGPSSRVFASLMDDRLVGTLCAGHDGHRGWLYYLAVTPQKRGQGIAAQLLRTAEAWLAEQGIRKVQLMVRPENQKVAEYYGKQGYQLTPRAVMAKWIEAGNGSKDTEAESVYLDTEITYLEMDSVPSFEADSLRFPPGCHLLEAPDPTLSFYRFLYNTVGAPWLWWERRIMPDRELSAILQDPRVELLVLYKQGIPAGFAELDRRHPGEVELAYFGLLPDFIGQGLGPPLLRHAVQCAWQTQGESQVAVLKVHTCNLDHPRALALYQTVGFTVRSRKQRRVIDPRLLGMFSTGS
ncbi:GNAT family acetyltransferase [Fodinicurvata halophila]|uniref:GNAT family acetyltransferase n=1 Tax=Fodinicurvata halophila TaxID=1419723 RepID=A0ABV8UJF1_9PROT